MRFIVLGAGAIGGVVGKLLQRLVVQTAREGRCSGWLAPEEVLERLR